MKGSSYGHTYIHTYIHISIYIYILTYILLIYIPIILAYKNMSNWIVLRGVPYFLREYVKYRKQNSIVLPPA